MYGLANACADGPCPSADGQTATARKVPKRTEARSKQCTVSGFLRRPRPCAVRTGDWAYLAWGLMLTDSHCLPAPDSLIASGKINFLEPSLQQPVQAIFKRIKMHNEFLSTTRSMRDQQQEGPMQENVHTYYEWMDKSEVSLKREIPRMMKELEDHFKIQHRTAA